jgi:hypothetical protein
MRPTKSRHSAAADRTKQTSRENLGALAVKKILIPLPFDELRQQHRDGAIRIVPLDLQDVIDDRLHYVLAVGLVLAGNAIRWPGRR